MTAETCANCGVDVDKEPSVLCDECAGEHETDTAAAEQQAYERGLEDAAKHVENHSCVASCCDAQPSAGEAKSLADCIRALAKSTPAPTTGALAVLMAALHPLVDDISNAADTDLQWGHLYDAYRAALVEQAAPAPKSEAQIRAADEAKCPKCDCRILPLYVCSRCDE